MPIHPQMEYRPEQSYFVKLDAPPDTSARYASHERTYNAPAPRVETRPKRRRPITIRPAGVVLLVLVGWLAWAYTTPGGPSARIGNWIDRTRGDVALAGMGPGLRQTTAYFNGLYESQGSYPNMSDTDIQQDQKAGFGLGMKFLWCNSQAVVLQTPSASGSVSRLLLAGHDLGDVNSAQGCPANLTKPAPWQLPDAAG
jgi:hypothetical protein